MYLPDWYYGLVPPGWWPDRPREAYFNSINILPIAANQTVTAELTFPKKVDSLVFGAVAFVTTVNDQTIICPLSGPCTQKTVRMKNPAGNITYSETFTGSVRDTGFVPFENLFGVYQRPGDRPVFWPVPIPVVRGGSLQMDIVNLNNAQDHNVRITFYCALMYEIGQTEEAA